MAVFDSNLYRQLSNSEFNKLLDSEAKLSIRGVGKEYVVLEFLAHLV